MKRGIKNKFERESEKKKEKKKRKPSFQVFLFFL